MPGQFLSREPADNGSADYRRAARRLRGRLVGRPVAMQHALQDLARREDSRRMEAGEDVRQHGQAGPAWPVFRPRSVHGPDSRRRYHPGGAAQRAFDVPGRVALGVVPERADELARGVEAALADGGVLHYSRRQELLREARHLGIGRFEANLIIAAVQHRFGAEHVHQNGGAAEGAAPGGEGRPGWREAGWLAAAVAVVALLEAAAVMLAWPRF